MDWWDNTQWFMAGFGTAIILCVIAIKIVFWGKRK